MTRRWKADPTSSLDAVVVGSGPNGLAAAITLARTGRRVHVIEGQTTFGGGARSGELTLPGFVHDLGSAIHPLAIASPFFQTLGLERHGLEWIQPEVALAHPLDGGRAAALYPTIDATCTGLGTDGDAYRRLYQPFVEQWTPLVREFLQPIVHSPRHPFLLARFGWSALQPAANLARRLFREEPAQALFAGLAAHSCLALEAPVSAGVGLVLGAAGHAVGWPLPRGGAGRISAALVACLREHGGTLEAGRPIDSLADVPAAKTVLLDLSTWEAAKICEGTLPTRYHGRLTRFPHGPAIFKIDYALAGPIPWEADACRRAGTVHLGGTLGEIATAERSVADGDASAKPFALLAQQSLFDSTRAPMGQHTAWVYCHVPFGCTADATNTIENQIERFAPGFRALVLARRISAAGDLSAQNASLAGGDITGGAMDAWHLLARPTAGATPYRTPVPGLYLCSSSTPPGGGVHGMCGYHAARAALARELAS